MDLHQAFRILKTTPGGIVSLEELELAREASPLAKLVVEADSVTVDKALEGLRIETIGRQTGGFLEVTVPAWSACLLVIHSGFCQTGTDGDSPDANTGDLVIYRRRNRNSAMVLAAGPDGFKATLIIAPRQPDAGPAAGGVPSPS